MAYRPVVAPPPGTLPMMRFAQPSGGGVQVITEGDDTKYATQLLLNAEGSAGSATFTDSSPYGVDGTVVTGSPVLSSTKAKFGSTSMRFAGSQAVSFGSAAEWTWMHGPRAKWTFEGWFAFDNFSAVQFLFATNGTASANSGVYLNVTAGRQVNLQITRGVAGSFVVNGTFTGTIPNDTDFHFLQVMWDSTLAADNGICYIDGVAAGTLSKTANAPSTGSPLAALRIGNVSAISLVGYADELRLTRQIWRDTAVPTAAFTA